MGELAGFDRSMAHLCAGLGHSDRHAGLRGYCTGLMAPLERKSVQPMASHLAPSATRSRHQSRHHVVVDSGWSDEEMLLRVAQWVVPAMDFNDGGWWIVDDTGFPEPGTHSVGVALHAAITLCQGSRARRAPRASARRRLRIAAALLRTRPRCPCCLRANARLRL